MKYSTVESGLKTKWHLLVIFLNTKGWKCDFKNQKQRKLKNVILMKWVTSCFEIPNSRVGSIFFFSTQIYTHTHIQSVQNYASEIITKNTKNRNKIFVHRFILQNLLRFQIKWFLCTLHIDRYKSFFTQTFKIRIWRPTPTYYLWRVNLISIDFGGQETIFYWIHLKWLKVLKKLRSLKRIKAIIQVSTVINVLLTDA